MPKGEYTRTEAGRRAYFVVTGIELPMKSKRIRMRFLKNSGNAAMNSISSI